MSPEFLAKEFQVYYDSTIGDVFYAYKEDEDYIRFRKCRKILMYLLDIKEGDEAKVLNRMTTILK